MTDDNDRVAAEVERLVPRRLAPKPAPSEEDMTTGIIAARQGTHGVFRENTVPMQQIKDLFRAQPNWEKMPSYQREALDMFAHKLGRILHGDHNYLDHWQDIAGYAERVVKTIQGDLTP